MNKLPVGQIIREAYVFTFGEIGTVIGLTWIPTLITTVASYFILRANAAVLDGFDSGTAPSDLNVLLPLPLGIVSMFVVAMIGVALVRQALGLRKGPAFAHIVIGTEELRVFAGFFGAYLLILLFVFALIVALGLIGAVAGSAAGPAGGAITGLAGLLGIVALIYAMVRLTFLLVPSAIVDGKFGVTRGWQLVSGNVGRIVLILFATLMPLLLAVNIAGGLIVGPPPPAPAQPPTDPAAAIHLWAEQFRALTLHLPALMGVILIMSPLLYSQFFTPAALAYRILSGKAIVPAHDG